MQDRVSGFITYTASGAAVIGGLTLNDWGVMIGSVVAALAFAHNVWHKRELRKIARAQCDMQTTALDED